MKSRREVYHLNVTAKQMTELQDLVRRERQRLASENTPRNENVVALKGLQKALDNSVYFFAKHNREIE